MMGDIPVWLGAVLAAATTVLVGLMVASSIAKHTQNVIRAVGKNAAAQAVPAEAASDSRAAAEIPNRAALVAAISASIATVLGTEPAGLRIVSLKKVG